MGGAFAVEARPLGLVSGGGKPLPEAIRGKMEAALGADFSNVRVHVGPQAGRIGAIAFTTGSDIYFAPGRYQPETPQGQELLGHELAHVVQQRAGRVRNPLGAGLAVVQDHTLEAEADRLGRQAAAHRVAVQAKMRSGSAPPPSPVPISPPISAGPGRYRLTAGVGGRQVGSVLVHTRDKGVIEVTDLSVAQTQRGHGIGRELLASAARTGLQFGRSKVTLAAQDNGSRHLTQWYRAMGFAQVGVNNRGFPQMEAPIRRVIAGAPQRRENQASMRSSSVVAQPKRAVPLPIPSRAATSHSPLVVQRADKGYRDPAKILLGLAAPKTLPPVDLANQKAASTALNELIEKGEIQNSVIFCVGGIVLPENLDRNMNDIIASAKLVKITPARGIPDEYEVIRKYKGLQNQIVSMVLWTAAIAGQIEYLKARSLATWGWRVVVEVHYYYNRDPSQINFHKDTLGQTLFVNLMYMNEKKIAGPEYVLNPPLVPEHEANTAKTLPSRFKQDLKKVREDLPTPTHIEASFIEPYGTVAFTDELIHHSTPNIGPRKISPGDIQYWLKHNATAKWGLKSEQYAKIAEALKDPSRIAPQSPWRSLFYLATAEEWWRYTRSDLEKAGVPSDAIEQLLDATHGEGYTSVSIPNAKFSKKQPRFPIANPNPHGRRLKLKRTMSLNPRLHEQSGVNSATSDAKRCFFRVWIRAIPPGAQL